MEPNIKYDTANLDIKKINGLNEINFDEKTGLTIGCTVTLTTIENHPLIKEKYPAIADAAHATANVQIRNMASIAGTNGLRSMFFIREHYSF